MFPKTSNTLTLVNYVRYVVKSQLSIPVIASGILENHAVVFLLEVLHAMLSRYITQNETEILQSDWNMFPQPLVKLVGTYYSYNYHWD